MGLTVRAKSTVNATVARAKRLAQAASGERVVQSIRIPDSLPRVMLVCLAVALAVVCFVGIRISMEVAREAIAEAEEQERAVADIAELCLQPVTIEDYADCFGDDCRLIYYLAVSDTAWRDALMQQEAVMQRSCNTIRHWAIKRDSSPAIITAEVRVP